MESTYVVDYGHHTVKCGRVYTGKGAGTKAARAAAASGTAVVAHTGSAGLEGNRFHSVDLVTPVLRKGCDAAASETAASSTRSSTANFGTSTLALLLPVATPRGDMEALTQVAFETLGARRFWTAASGACALSAAGLTSGTVVDCGEFETRVVPVHETLPQHALTRVTARGGWHHTSALREAVLQTTPAAFANNTDSASVIRAVEAAKANCGWSAAPNGHEAAGTRTFELPDGEVAREVTAAKCDLNVAACRLFDVRWRSIGGALGGSAAAAAPGPGVVDALKSALRAASLDAPAASRDVVLSGGPSLIPGTDDRVSRPLQPSHDVAATAPPSDTPANEVPAVATEPPFATTAGIGSYAVFRPLRDRQNAPWAGASILCQLSSFTGFTVDRAAYNEEGPRCVRACTS